MLRSMSGRLTFSSSAKKQKKDERERKRLEQEEAAAEEHRQAQEKLRLEQRQAALQEEQRKLQEEERKLQEAVIQRDVERLAEMARRSAGKICEKVPNGFRCDSSPLTWLNVSFVYWLLRPRLRICARSLFDMGWCKALYL